MISVRKRKNEIVIIQNNKLTYNLLKIICLLFFIIASVLSILKNNIEMIYINGGTCIILYFLSIKISKIKKRVFIKLYNQKLKVYSVYEEKDFALNSIQEIIIKKDSYGARKFCYILKLKLMNEQEEFLLKSPYWKELNQTRKVILGYKNEADKNGNL